MISSVLSPKTPPSLLITQGFIPTVRHPGTNRPSGRDSPPLGTTRVNIARVQNFTWICSSITIWASVKTGLTIFAASIPALRILFIRIRSSYDYTDEPSSGYEGEEITLQAHKDESSARSVIIEHEINVTQEVTVEQNVAGLRRLDA